MSRSSNNLFAVEYRNVPGKGVFASGGLKFQASEDEMRREHQALLRRVSLNTLLGEAALWVLWPSTAAIWAFPLLVWRLPIDMAVLAAIGLFLAIQIAHMLFYAQRLNYVGLLMGNRALQAVVYAACIAAFWLHGDWQRALAAGVWLVVMATGVVQVIFTVPFMPILKRLFALRPADQALQNVARYHGRRASGR
ncbi:MAG: hypothetical protein HY238_15085 [Acidobacteria bacterium]|nr:hypothetical protein [Acidobacteriota bacterium]